MAVTYSSEVEKWLNVISQYDNEFKKWEARCTKILKRYRDDTRSAASNETAKFNILWSNVQTLIPAVYARMPKADVARRFTDNDPVGRVASMLLERALDYEIEHFTDFRSCMRHSVEDRFLGGRGIGWLRYEPHIVTQEIPEDGLEVTSTIEGEGEESGSDNPPKTQEVIESEQSPTDYVHWKDFGHTAARTWEEVGQVWRWVYMTEEAVTERFGKDVAKKIQFDSSPDQLNKYTQKANEKDKAKICELWDKETGKVCWFSKNYPKVIDERDDPLELEGFFPCPRPLYATTTSDSLVPVPDFVLYQDQANELDILSDRIDGLIKALRVRGIYDSSVPELQRLLTEGDNNTLVPTDKWSVFSEKGGLKGTIDLLPLDMIASALLQCYQAQTQVKGQVYEITGISDIIRGESVASETATAQQIKGQYAGLRLKSMQDAVAIFASNLLQIKAQIICAKYQDETILNYAAAKQFSAVDQQLIPQALQVLRDEPLRSFRIEIEADSLVQLDETQDKADAVEFLKTFGMYMQQAVPAGQAEPEIVPMLMAGAQFLVSRYKQAKSMEGVIDNALQALQTKAQTNAQNPKPTPEQIKMQGEQANVTAQGQIDLQLSQIKSDADKAIAAGTAQANMQMEQMRLQHQSQMKTQETAAQQAFDKWEAELKAATAIMVARIGANPAMDFPETAAVTSSSENVVNALGENVQKVLDHVTASHDAMASMHADTMTKIGNVAQTLAAPKRVVRGSDGRVTGVEAVQPQLPMVN